MKIKSDFITNSSSSSFVVWGVDINRIRFSDGIYLRAFEEHKKNIEDIKEEQPERFHKWWASEYDNVAKASASPELSVEYARKNIDFHRVAALILGDATSDFDINVDEVGVVGLSPDTMVRKHEDIPFGKVKEFVAEKLNESFGTDFKASDINYYEEGWYDG